MHFVAYFSLPFLVFVFIPFTVVLFCLYLFSGSRHVTNNPVAAHRPKSAMGAKVANEQANKKRAQAPRKGPFAIKVFFLGSSSPPCQLVVTSTDTMETVKQKIEFQQGIPAERMHLFVGRRQIGAATSGSKSKGKKGPTVGSVGLKPGQELNVALS